MMRQHLFCLLLALVPAFSWGAELPAKQEAKEAAQSPDASNEESEEKAISTELLFKGTALSSQGGGIQQGNDYMQNLEFKLGVDTAKLWDLPDSSAYIHVLLNSGGKMNAAYVGSLMGVDNSEVTQNGVKLYQAWLNKNFLNSTLSVLAGVYPIDTEFYVTDSSGIFIHPSFGMSAELGQTGSNGPSVYPYAGLGVRIKYQPSPVFYIQAALVDGNPGDGRHPHWTRINLAHGDGSLFIAEIDYRPAEAHHATEEMTPEKHALLTRAEMLEERYEPIGKYAIGFWSYSKRYADLLETDAAGNPLQRKNQGMYLLAEQSLYRADDMERDVAAFFRYGLADRNVNAFDYSYSVGVRVRGLFSGRADDFFGIATTISHVGDKYRLAQLAAGISTAASENAVEATYRYQREEWLAIQPFIQHIAHPGVDNAIGNATVLGVRCEASF